MNAILNTIQYLAIIAFSISGALSGVKKGFDIFGVIFLGIITSIGGGILRDMLIGVLPPTSLIDPRYALVGGLCSIIAFINGKKINKLKKIILITDAIGLGLFTALGAAKAYNINQSIFLVICMGMITGIGGGLIKDVICKDVPSIFHKEIYALATVIGAIIFYFVYRYINETLALYLSSMVTIIIRLIGLRKNIHLPKKHEHIEKHLIH